jgi:hypothetical protein
LPGSVYCVVSDDVNDPFVLLPRTTLLPSVINDEPERPVVFPITELLNILITPPDDAWTPTPLPDT